MKKLLIILLACATAPTLLMAEGPDAGGKPKKHGPPPPDWEQLQDELGLSAAQLQSLQAHRESQKTKMQAIKNDQSLTKEQKRERMRAVMEAGRPEVESILTPAQIEKMKQLRQEKRLQNSKKDGPDQKPAPTE